MDRETESRLVEIRDPEIDPAEIMQQIRERVRQRREQLGYDGRTFPTFGVTDCPEPPADRPYDANLYYYLRLANDSYGQIETGSNLAPSPATRVPVLGRLWGTIRAEVHSLVLFYVNRSAHQQVTMNRYLVSVANRLAAVTAEQAETIDALRAEVAALRDEMASREKG